MGKCFLGINDEKLSCYNYPYYYHFFSAINESTYLNLIQDTAKGTSDMQNVCHSMTRCNNINTAFKSFLL